MNLSLVSWILVFLCLDWIWIVWVWCFVVVGLVMLVGVVVLWFNLEDDCVEVVVVVYDLCFGIVLIFGDVRLEKCLVIMFFDGL